MSDDIADRYPTGGNRWSKKRVAALIALAVGIGSIWTLQPGTVIQHGNALGLAKGATVGFGGGERHVGQELILVFEGFVNGSSVPIDLRGIAFNDRATGGFEFVEIGLIPDEVNGTNFVMGSYQNSPPAFEWVTGECISHEIEPFEQRLDPGESVHIAYHVRLVGSGPYRFENPLIYYRSGGKEFYELLRVELWGDVKDTREPVPVDVTEIPCDDEDDLLPGNVLPTA